MNEKVIDRSTIYPAIRLAIHSTIQPFNLSAAARSRRRLLPLFRCKCQKVGVEELHMGNI